MAGVVFFAAYVLTYSITYKYVVNLVISDSSFKFALPLHNTIYTPLHWLCLQSNIFNQFMKWWCSFI